jgi:hypothetical protein
MLWTERNEAAFEGVFWSLEQLRCKIWVDIIDYGRLAWQKLLGRCKRSPDKRNKLISQFKKQWCSNEVFARWVNDRPYWKLTGPNISLCQFSFKILDELATINALSRDASNLFYCNLLRATVIKCYNITWRHCYNFFLTIVTTGDKGETIIHQASLKVI